MPQAEERQTDNREADEAYSERERPHGNKLWGVYISEAQSSDKGLIDGWRSEMDGLLIFAGLFSGVVTTFIIESYKTLRPDPASETVALLNQISRQLANLNNGTAVTDALPPVPAFSPPISSVVCNALWFTSLGLSLSCALVATLVKQWAQGFPHRTAMFPTISIQSRIYMYLHNGLLRFNMHVAVRAPLLFLHGALVLFFGGLVAFLVPVNNVIMSIFSALLLLFVSVYAMFTAHPLFFLDSPFQTPLTQIIWSLNQILRNVLRAYVPQTVTAIDTGSPAKPSVTVDTRLQTLSMQEAMKSASLHSTVETETAALAWTIQSLSEDKKLEPFVEGLPQALWDFKTNQPRGVYRTQFKRLLQNPQVPLGQRLADFMDGSNSNLLDPTVRSRRQLAVLRAIWALCAFSIHTESPLERPIGDIDVEDALLGSKFLSSPDVQCMVPAVLALVRLNVIESERLYVQRSNSYRDPELEKQRTYKQYLRDLSDSPASFQREVTHSLFYRSEDPFQAGDRYNILQLGLEELIRSGADGTEDNLVFAARRMISAIADGTWNTPPPGIALFLVRHPSLAVYGPDSVWQPDRKYRYTRYLCHCLCQNLAHRIDLKPSVDSLRLIYDHWINDDPLARHPGDLDTHFHVLRTLRSSGARAADTHMHRLVALVQCVVVFWVRQDLSESAELLSIFDDEPWFRAAIGLDEEEWTQRASTQGTRDLILSCACVGVMTTFLEQCAQNPDQTEPELDFETLKSVQKFSGIWDLQPGSRVLGTEIQRRFADAVSEFLRKYPTDSLAEGKPLGWVLFCAVNQDRGWINDLDALQVLDVAVFDTQMDSQQQTQGYYAPFIHEQIEERLPPEVIFGAYVSLVSDGE
ncbi:unnamed protein product [Mycena citricolor]|uniref:DUF6535 domain-containing protein n=1 Tax=Mycena citricolor TaxID=2018698 RepID=A0AAD2GZ46_9AGAR|nr:unnamed protein product [Mycena citricolor]